MEILLVRRLSAAFYAAYSAQEYPEILRKNERPYTCLMIEQRHYLICIPFRSDMNHKQGFLFSGTKRSGKSQSGLDYSKIVLIKDRTYVDTEKVAVDQDEYTMAAQNIHKITQEAVAYINTYIDHMTGQHVLPKAAFKRKYAYSTLPYFHGILHITEGVPVLAQKALQDTVPIPNPLQSVYPEEGKCDNRGIETESAEPNNAAGLLSDERQAGRGHLCGQGQGAEKPGGQLFP